MTAVAGEELRDLKPATAAKGGFLSAGAGEGGGAGVRKRGRCGGAAEGFVRRRERPRMGTTPRRTAEVISHPPERCGSGRERRGRRDRIVISPGLRRC